METNYNNNMQANVYNKNEEAMTIGNWIGTMLLMLIPIVNIVLMFVWAFGSNVNKSKKTYFQAQLILVGVVLAIYVLLFVLILGALS